MSALDKFEGFVEKLFDKPFSGLLRAEMQPVEIAKRVAKAMEAEQSLGVDKIYVPNEYVVRISAPDFQHFASIRLSLERELAQYLTGVAREQQFTLLSPPVVTLEPDEEVGRREIRVAARLVDQLASPVPPRKDQHPVHHTQVLDAFAVSQAAEAIGQESAQALAQIRASNAAIALLTGETVLSEFPINKVTTGIGRALDNDLVIEDPRVSRYHAQIAFRGGRFYLKDLQSSNGTVVNDEPIGEILLVDGDAISIGDTELTFSLKSA